MIDLTGRDVWIVANILQSSLLTPGGGSFHVTVNVPVFAAPMGSSYAMYVRPFTTAMIRTLPTLLARSSPVTV